jgi:hypothetical protein
MSAAARTTVGIKAFERPECLFMTLQSLVGQGFARVIVADDSSEKAPIREVVGLFDGVLPIDYRPLPFDTGLSEGRNRMVAEVETEFFLLLDDDQVMAGGIDPLASALDRDPDLGGISLSWWDRGSPFCDAGWVRRYDGFIYRGLARGGRPLERASDGVVGFDFVPNSTLFRTRVFADLRWDPDYKIGAEHLDFYLRAREQGIWRFAAHEGAFVWHVPLRGPRYQVFRDREAIARARFREKQRHRGILIGASWVRRRWTGRAIDWLVRLGVPGGWIAGAEALAKRAVGGRP